MSVLFLVPFIFPYLPSPTEARLEVRNVQASYLGCTGPERAALDYYPPYDGIAFRYVVGGAKTVDGSIDVNTAIQLTDARGETLLRNADSLKYTPTLRGTAFLASSALLLNTSLPPGDYTAKVTVKDNRSLGTATFERKVRIKAVELAINGLVLAYDAEAKLPAPTTFVVGQTLYWRSQVVGLGLGEFTEKVELLDGRTRETLCGTAGITGRNAGSTPQVCGGAFLNLNRPGQFFLRLTVTDKQANKATKLETPVSVIAP